MAVGTIIGKTRSKVEVNSDLEEILEALSKKHNLIFFNFAWVNFTSERHNKGKIIEDSGID